MTIRQGPKKYAKTVCDIVKDRAYLKFYVKDTVPDMVERMHTHGGSAGGVIDTSGKCVGLITEKEIVRKAFGNVLNLQKKLDDLCEKKSTGEMTAWDVMIANPASLHPEDSVEDALDYITYFGYRYMPVINSQGTYTGIVDARELHQHLYAKSQDLMQSKDTLLSYFMGTEPYGARTSVN